VHPIFRFSVLTQQQSPAVAKTTSGQHAFQHVAGSGLGNIHRDPPRLIARQERGRRCANSGHSWCGPDNRNDYEYNHRRNYYRAEYPRGRRYRIAPAQP